MRAKPSSMTRRLIVGLTVATMLFWIAAVAAGALVMRGEFDEVFDSALQQTSDRLMPLLVEDLMSQTSDGGPRQTLASSAGSESYLTYQLRDQSGRVLVHSHDAPAEPFDVPLQAGYFTTPNHRVLTTEAISGSLFLQVADPLFHRREAMAETAGALFLPLVPLVPLSVLAIWWIVRRTLAPLDRFREEISTRDGGNLAPIALAGLPAELRDMESSVDRLLDRLRAALESEREFAANSAHELRTPIAGALAQTQRLVRELPEGPVKTRAREVEASLANLSRLTEKLLQMARADSGIGMSDVEADLVPIIKLVVEEFQRMRAYVGRLQFDAPKGLSMMRRIDVDAFGIVLRNLIENALFHGVEETPVIVALSEAGVITVANGGQVIPAEQLTDLVKRFRRGRTGAAGSGLGLAIAISFVKTMDGTIEFRSPATGRVDGFEVAIRLPSASDTRASPIGDRP